MLKVVGASWPLLSRWEACTRVLLAQDSKVSANPPQCRSALFQVIEGKWEAP